MLYKENIGEISHNYLPNEIFVWSVPNLFDVGDDHGLLCFSSRSFSYAGESWRLALIKRYNEDYAGFFLWCSRPPEHKYLVKLSLLNAKSGNPRIHSGMVDSYGHFGTWRFMLFYKYGNPSDDLNAASQNGVVVFSCEIERQADLVRNSTETNEDATQKETDHITEKKIQCTTQEDWCNSSIKGVNRLGENLKNLYLEKKLCDVVLKASDREYSAHRAILAARSPVFGAMFNHDMAEKNRGIVDIPDCSPEALDIFLLFLYSGELKNICTDTMYDVYKTAVKYNIGDLKYECAEYIKGNLSVDNFCDVMALVLQYEEEDMKTYVTNFFCSRVKEIIKTDSYLEFNTRNPVIAIELVKKALNI